MSKSRRRNPCKTKKFKRTEESVSGPEHRKMRRSKRIANKNAMEILADFAKRIERLEQDNAVLNEALRALVLKDTFSMHEIGARYVTGEYGCGEQQDFDLGIWFYKRGAMLGDIECQWDYAMMLYSGEHIPQNKREALFWFRKAAENPVDKYDLRKNALEMCEIVRQELAEPNDYSALREALKIARNPKIKGYTDVEEALRALKS